MRPFVYDAQPGRIVFGPGSLGRLKAEVEALGVRRVLVLSTPGQRTFAAAIADMLGDLCVGLHDRAVMHVPVETANEGIAEAHRLGADCALAVGGGSTIGLAKAIALETGLPVVAVPTTYSGSEMTPIWGLTEGGVKRTGRDRRVLPRTVVYDPELTVGLPAAVTGPSGMNAIAHCVEALYSETANPVISLMAEEGIRALAESLPTAVAKPADIEARSGALYGAWLAGAALGAVGMALHHKLCHTLGGTFDLPHAEVHTVAIPYVTAFNAEAVPEAIGRVARALGVEGAGKAAGALFDLAQAIGARTSLAEIGMRESDLDHAAEIATRNPYYNPRSVTREGVRALLDDAYFGRRPASG